jgi:hypothetical protein
MKKIYFFTLIGCMLCTLISCEKELSTPPPNAKVNETAVVDLKSAQITLNGVYYRHANASATTYNWQNQNVHPGMLTGMLGYGIGAYDDEINANVNSRFMQVLNPWAQWYATVNAANGMLDGLASLADGIISPTRKLEMEAEAKFLRAYSNFKLLMFFAEWNDQNSAKGILLHNQLSSITTIIKARSSVSESYKAILDDLDFAVANGPTNNPNYYMNKYAAMVLEARVLLTRGQNADIVKALSLTDQIIGSNKYSLEPNLKDIFHTKGLASNEVIMGIKPQALQENIRTNSGAYSIPTVVGVVYVAKRDFINLLAGDPRASWMHGPLTPDEYQTESPDTYFYTKFLPFDATANAPTPFTQVSETSYVSRLSEVYLLKAEAIIRSGGSLSDARLAIKTVMARAGIPSGSILYAPIDNANTPIDLWKQVYFETLRNLTGEDAIDWFALLRFPFETIQQLRPTIITKSQLWFGVPVSEFQSNPLFGPQNAGGYPIQ